MWVLMSFVYPGLFGQDLQADLAKIQSQFYGKGGVSFDFTIQYYGSDGKMVEDEKVSGEMIMGPKVYYHSLANMETVGLEKALFLLDHEDKIMIVYPPRQMPNQQMMLPDTNMTDWENVQFEMLENGLAQYTAEFPYYFRYPKMKFRFDPETYAMHSLVLYTNTEDDEALEILYLNIQTGGAAKANFLKQKVYATQRNGSWQAAKAYSQYELIDYSQQP